MHDAANLVDENFLLEETKNLPLKDEDFSTFRTLKEKDGTVATTTEEQHEEHMNHIKDDIHNHAPPEVEETSKRFVVPKDFELLRVIGMGSFGKVLQVRNKHSEEVYAMKVISKRLLRRKTGYIENIQAERDILRKMRHPFVVTMHCSFQTREKLFIIMDFCSGGELFLRLGREGVFLESTAAFYLAEITLALEHLHSKHILHRDLKPENILLHSDGHLCLTDFGLAKDFSPIHGANKDPDGFATTICGTGEYMAPEMVAKKGYGRAADFWSLGCIAYEMLSGHPPFSSRKGTKDLFRKILNERVKMPDATSNAHKLLKGLLMRDSTKRLGTSRGTMFQVGGVSELKQQPFFNGIDWALLEERKVEPPAKFAVQDDTDTSHFHQEFVEMPLPRSVKEMSKVNYLAKRVTSDTFRGFSFIQDDFVLPDRPEQEHDHYWNSAISDGESDSEAASSKHGSDTDSINAQPAAEPPKKKRPPRKKKKKKDAAATTTPAPQVVPLEKDPPQPQDNAAPPLPSVSETTPQPQTVNETTQPSIPTPPTQPPPPATQKKVVKKETWQTIPKKEPTKPTPTKKPTSVTATTPFSIRPKSNTPYMQNPTATRPQQQQMRAQHTPKPAYKPTPGSWAAMAAPPQKSKPQPRQAPSQKPAIATQSTYWPSLGDPKPSSQKMNGNARRIGEPSKQKQLAWKQGR